MKLTFVERIPLKLVFIHQEMTRNSPNKKVNSWTFNIDNIRKKWCQLIQHINNFSNTKNSHDWRLDRSFSKISGQGFGHLKFQTPEEGRPCGPAKIKGILTPVQWFTEMPLDDFLTMWQPNLTLCWTRRNKWFTNLYYGRYPFQHFVEFHFCTRTFIWQNIFQLSSCVTHPIFLYILWNLW